MTLGIAIITPSRAFQSSDYCVSSFDGSHVITQNSTKVVDFLYKNWIGNLTYSGIGMLAGRHTAEYVLDWMHGCGDMAFTEVAEHIRGNAERWLASITADQAWWSHRFVLVGFEEGEPRAAIITNGEPSDMAPCPMTRITTSLSASMMPSASSAPTNRDAYHRRGARLC